MPQLPVWGGIQIIINIKAFFFLLEKKQITEAIKDKGTIT